MSDSSTSTRPALVVLALRLCLVLTLLLSGLTLVRPAKAEWSSLTGVLPPHTNIENVQVSPDSHYVVFTADIDQDGQNNLYSVPITGTQPLRLNPPLVPGGSVTAASVTADSQYVLYLADQEVDDRWELYCVPIGGGTLLRLNKSLVDGGDVLAFKEDVIRSLVVYQADQDVDEVLELYSVPVTGGPKTKLNPDFVKGGFVAQYQIDLPGGRVVYSGKAGVVDWMELYSVPIQGGAVVKLNPSVSTHIYDFQVNPAFPHVMFLAREASSSQWALFGSNTDGTGLQKRNSTLAPGENVTSFHLSPQGDRVAYIIAAYPDHGMGALWHTNPFGGSSQLLSEMLDPSYGVPDFGYDFTPDGNRLLYLYQATSSAATSLLSVWVAGGPLDRQESYIFGSGHSPGDFIISPDGSRVVLEDYHATGNIISLHTAGVSDGNVTFLGYGQYPRISSDSSQVIYQSAQPDSHLTDIIRQSIGGGGEVNLSRMGPNDFASDLLLSPDSRWIIYQVAFGNGLSGRELRVSNGEAGQDITPTPTGGAPSVTPSVTTSPTPYGQPTVTPAATPTLDPDADNFLYLNVLQR